MKTFSSRLRILRADASQAEMAAKFGVSQVAYGRWELGKAEPRYDVLAAICKNFSVSADWLLGLSDSRPSGVAVTAGGSVAVNHSTVSADTPASMEASRLLAIIESQQRVIEALTKK